MKDAMPAVIILAVSKLLLCAFQPSVTPDKMQDLRRNKIEALRVCASSDVSVVLEISCHRLLLCFPAVTSHRRKLMNERRN